MMDEDGGKLLDMHSLSFDSTLESLLEVDFPMDTKESAYNPPTESAMSPPLNHGVDLSSGEGGDTGDNLEVLNEQTEGTAETNNETPLKVMDEEYMKSEEQPEVDVSVDLKIGKFDKLEVKETNKDSEKINEANSNSSYDPDAVSIVSEGKNEIQETFKGKENCITTEGPAPVDTTVKAGVIESLNFNELKAKRQRKVAEDKSSNSVDDSPDITRNIHNSNNQTSIEQSKVLNTKTVGKRKLETQDDENLQVPKKLPKVESSDEQLKVENIQKVIESSSQDIGQVENKTDTIIEDTYVDTDRSTNSPRCSVEDSVDSDRSTTQTGVFSDNICTTESLDDTLTGINAELNDDEDIFEVVDSVQFEDDDKVSNTNEDLSDRDQDNNDPISGSESSDNDLDENEIDAMLDEGLIKREPDVKTEKTEKDLKPGEYICREKLVLEEKGTNVFEMLPPGWIQVSHISGMFVYLHKESRVCTMSKPYCLGQLSVRKHDIPLSAIPCLQYKRAVDKELESESETKNPDEANTGDQEMNGENRPSIIPQAIVESADKTQMLEAKELHEYCKSLFQFKTVLVKKFRTWKEKRIHLLEERRKRPGLPSNTQLITCALPENSSNKSKKRKKNFVLNPVGKTPVCILHEYTQHVLKVQPTYEFKEIENAETPYKATVLIDGIQYGFGVASGKRQAKAKAAKASLAVFMPQLAEQWKETGSSKHDQSMDLLYFEDVAIEDPRVTDLCEKAALPKPYEVLVECLRRNFGLGDTNLAIDKKIIANQKTEFSLSVGKHTAKVVCKNKREGKQRAAQAMLQVLHPNLNSWAAILRLYSKSTEQGFKEREEERAAIVAQFSKEKNFEILDQLKQAMIKLRAQKMEQTKSPTKSNIQSTTQPLDL